MRIPSKSGFGLRNRRDAMKIESCRPISNRDEHHSMKQAKQQTLEASAECVLGFALVA